MEFFKWENQFNSFVVFPQSTLSWVVSSALDFLTKRSCSFDANAIQTRCEIESGEQVNKGEVEKACEGLKFLLHWILTRNPQNTGKYNLESILNSYAELPEATVSGITGAYSHYSPTSNTALEKGTVFQDSQWTLGVTIQTDQRAEVLEPYVRGSFTLVDANTGVASRRVVEFSVPQFQVEEM